MDEASGWREMATAPRDGTRILVTVRNSEQGPAEVDVAHWARADQFGIEGWRSADSHPGQIIGYAMQSSDNAQADKLLVWLQVGFYLPSAALDTLNTDVRNASAQPAPMDDTVAQLQAQIVDLSAQLAKLSAQVDQLQAVQK